MNSYSPHVLLVAVVYRNHSEVEEFCSRVKAGHGDFVHIAVCDNSPNGEQHCIAAAELTVSRPDNPGYLDGGIAALQGYLGDGAPMPGWVVLANTDVRFEPHDAFSVLNGYTPSESVILAPSIVEGDAGEKNPHGLSPRSRNRHRINRWATFTPALAVGYLVLSRFRRHGNRGLPNRQATIGTPMYAPYGAVIIFSGGFLSRFGLPAGVPLLAEEWAIAEHAASTGTPVVFEPRIRAYHDAHATTGGSVTRRRAEMLSRAFRHISRGWDGHDVWTP